MPSTLKSQIQSLITRQWLILTPEEEQSLTDQEYDYLKNELIAHQVYKIGQAQDLAALDFLAMVNQEFSYYDAQNGTDLMAHFGRFLTIRYHNYLRIDGFEKILEFSAIQLSAKIKSIDFRRLVDILKESIVYFENSTKNIVR